MANQIAFCVYKINSQVPIPAGSTPFIGFPSTGIIVRSANQPMETAGTDSTRWAYGIIQVIATGDQYYVRETRAAIITAAG
jgi:hypothetical protein